MHRVRPTAKTLSGISGKGLAVKGITTIDCTINDVVKPVSFLVIEESDIAIFGLDAMKDFGIKIDSANRTIECNGSVQRYLMTNNQMGKDCQSFVVHTKDYCDF